MKSKYFLLTCFLAGLLVACSSADDNEPPATESSTVPAPEIRAARQESRTAAQTRTNPPTLAELDDEKPLLEAARLHGASEAPGTGLDLLIFASDRREYRESLALIAENSSDEQYQQLDAALRWLLINDPSIMNDEQRLFTAINGKSGSEILEMVVEKLGQRQ
jgi:hypothetical protein